MNIPKAAIRRLIDDYFPKTLSKDQISNLTQVGFVIQKKGKIVGLTHVPLIAEDNRLILEANVLIKELYSPQGVWLGTKDQVIERTYAIVNQIFNQPLTPEQYHRVIQGYTKAAIRHNFDPMEFGLECREWGEELVEDYLEEQGDHTQPQEEDWDYHHFTLEDILDDIGILNTFVSKVKQDLLPKEDLLKQKLGSLMVYQRSMDRPYPLLDGRLYQVIDHDYLQIMRRDLKWELMDWLFRYHVARTIEYKGHRIN